MCVFVPLPWELSFLCLALLGRTHKALTPSMSFVPIIHKAEGPTGLQSQKGLDQASPSALFLQNHLMS